MWMCVCVCTCALLAPDHLFFFAAWLFMLLSIAPSPWQTPTRTHTVYVFVYCVYWKAWALLPLGISNTWMCVCLSMRKLSPSLLYTHFDMQLHLHKLTASTTTKASRAQRSAVHLAKPLVFACAASHLYCIHTHTHTSIYILNLYCVYK